MKSKINIIALKEGKKSKILLIYTGGTLGMVYDQRQKSLVPFKFDQILENLPELNRLEEEVHFMSFETLLDSANISITDWQYLYRIILENYQAYDGFVVIHGTDSMAYTASALSFMIQNLSKPIVFTGAQLPIGIPRTDARENLLSAIEIAGSKREGKTMVPEVCIYFNGRLLRGNRAKKRESSQFDAFDSENYPYLAEIGVHIDFYEQNILRFDTQKTTTFKPNLDANVASIRLFPGLRQSYFEHFLEIPGLKGIVMESYGSGTAPSATWFTKTLENAISKNLTVLNISQCSGGRVNMGEYATSRQLQDIGVISGADLNAEAALSKLMWVLGNYDSKTEISKYLKENLAGELSESFV
jgi:L-asparaginase